MPFVDVARTKSMFILDLEQNARHIELMERKKVSSSLEIMDEIRDDVTWLEMKFGEVLLFTQNVMHGNVLNEESTTRWSTNCRFKSVLSPFEDKRNGEFFEPISLRPATRLGAAYSLPNFNSGNQND